MKKGFHFIVIALMIVGCEHGELSLDKPKEIGVFSIAPDRQVTFSQGNLQFHRTTNTWHFAKEQWETIGASNLGSPVRYSGWITSSNESLGSKIDLFGWGTGDNPTHVSIELEDYPDYYEWGYNIIDNDKSKKWRTLHIDEWKYLLYERENADSLLSSIQLGGLPGTILLPDDWVTPEGVNFIQGYPQGEIIIPIELPYVTWKDWVKLEANGAVFLPMTYMRSSYAVTETGWYGGEYWVASHSGDETGVSITLGVRSSTFSDRSRTIGLSVRLVKDL